MKRNERKQVTKSSKILRGLTIGIAGIALVSSVGYTVTGMLSSGKVPESSFAKQSTSESTSGSTEETGSTVEQKTEESSSSVSDIKHYDVFGDQIDANTHLDRYMAKVPDYSSGTMTLAEFKAQWQRDNVNIAFDSFTNVNPTVMNPNDYYVLSTNKTTNNEFNAMDNRKLEITVKRIQSDDTSRARIMDDQAFGIYVMPNMKVFVEPRLAPWKHQVMRVKEMELLLTKMGVKDMGNIDPSSLEEPATGLSVDITKPFNALETKVFIYTDNHEAAFNLVQ